MDREIKFRAWHPTQGMTQTPILQRSDYTGVVRCAGFDKDGNDVQIKLMQFTGLKDKNGKEIFEGDALRRHHDDGESNYEGVVSWLAQDDWLGWCVMCGSYPEMLRVSDQDQLEVIGNIYETPELAK